MNFVNAVRELKDNPSVKEVTWPLGYKMTGRTHGVMRIEGKTLVFGDGTPILKAGPDFLLREDFELVCKKPEPLRMRTGTECQVLRVKFNVGDLQAACQLIKVLGINESMTPPILQYLQEHKFITVLVTSNQFVDYLTSNISRIQWSDGEVVNVSDSNVFDLT